jgi:hypothetical protein
LHALALLADLGPGALVAELAVDPFGLGAQVLQQGDLVGVAGVHAGVGHGLHLDGLAGLAIIESAIRRDCPDVRVRLRLAGFITRLFVGGREGFGGSGGHGDGCICRVSVVWV